MPQLLVLGAGTAGTMVANKLTKKLGSDWKITLVDKSTEHHYQPGYLFVPFGTYEPEELVKPTEHFLPKEVELINADIDRIAADQNEVILSDGKTIGYDQLIIATGTTPRPDQTEGTLGPQWRKTVHEFYTLEGAKALERALTGFTGGRLVVHLTELPIKCPVAPLEFAFLVDHELRERGLRDKTELTYVTPLPGAFTKPVASDLLGTMFVDREIKLEPDFVIERIDEGYIASYDEREVPFDLLVTVPINMGADFVGRSGLGDELNHVPVDSETFLSPKFDNIFALGDAANLPTSKAGSVAHFAVEIFIDNFMQHIAGEPMTGKFDGHANCFIETGGGKALLIDFDYETQPLPGHFPLEHMGPMSLLKETRLNHIGKMAFKSVYWNALIKGRPIPLPHHRTGHLEEEATTEKKEVTL